MDSENIEIVSSTEPVEPCWPFWGLLGTREKNACSPAGAVHGGIFLHHGHSDFFDRFQSIGMQALRMLQSNGRTVADLRNAAEEIQSEIHEWIDLYIEQETESLVRALHRDGGWELSYLPPDSRGTADEIRDLLANWSSEWDDRPSLPKPDDYSDLIALQECLGFEHFDKSQLIHFGLIEPDEHEFFAVLALMIVCEAVHTNPRTKIRHYWAEPTVSQVKAVGQATINAVEAIAYAERLQFEQRIRNSIALKQPEILANELSRRTSERAANAANTRHAPNNKARNWIYKEWAMHRDAYDGNKSAFTRDYVKRALNEFNVSVTEKQMREVWLKDTPVAGKQAG